MAGGHSWQESWPLQQTVRILLECILVYYDLVTRDWTVPRGMRIKCKILNATGKVAEFKLNHKISILIASTCKSSLRCPTKRAQNLSEFGSYWHKHLCVPKGRALIRYFRTVKKLGCQKQMLLHEIFICVMLDLERRSFAPGEKGLFYNLDVNMP